MDNRAARYTLRISDDHLEHGELGELRASHVFDAQPRRTFRWHKGQRHYPGRYWCATTRDFVGYESRLELSALLLEDFDPRSVRIASQPFELVADRGGRDGSHVPDYMVEYVDHGYAVVDVKPARRLAQPEVREALDWAGGIIKARGWEYRVTTEPDAVLLSNVRFLAGYRRAFLFPDLDTHRVEVATEGALTVGQALRSAGSALGDTGYARTVVLHLLWRQVLRFDLSLPLGNDILLEHP